VVTASSDRTAGITAVSMLSIASPAAEYGCKNSVLSGEVLAVGPLSYFLRPEIQAEDGGLAQRKCALEVPDFNFLFSLRYCAILSVSSFVDH
jgi:hypothetical protein